MSYDEELYITVEVRVLYNRTPGTAPTLRTDPNDSDPGEPDEYEDIRIDIDMDDIHHQLHQHHQHHYEE